MPRKLGWFLIMMIKVSVFVVMSGQSQGKRASSKAVETAPSRMATEAVCLHQAAPCLWGIGLSVVEQF